MLNPVITQNVFHLKNGKTTGSCFMIQSEGKAYFITARHVIKNLKANDGLEIFTDHKWRVLFLRTVEHHPTADVSVFLIDKYFNLPGLQPSVKKITQGQEAYFLGFPDGFQHYKDINFSGNNPTAIIKKATLSCIIRDNTGHYFLLEGHNNPGFSGGPVVFQDVEDQSFKAAAVISGHKPASEAIYPKGEISPLSTDGKTSIVLAYSIENAMEMVRHHRP